jgi:hypothetical protein
MAGSQIARMAEGHLKLEIAMARGQIAILHATLRAAR